MEKDKEVKHLMLSKGMSVGELVDGFGYTAFNSRRIADAVDIYEEMIDIKARKFFGLAGAMVPAGMRNIISDMIDWGWIDVLVTTGANLTHDLIEAFGCHHYLRSSSESEKDAELRREGINRIYDVFVSDEAFITLETNLWEIFEDIGEKGKDISISGLIREAGSRIEDENSIIRRAYEKDVPIFCPALADSIFGLHAWMYGQTHSMSVNAFADMREFSDLCFESDKSGVAIVGGGVPKNFIFQSMLLNPDAGFDYAIQITMDRVETGGLSGASLEEAVSWGKIKERGRRVVVYSDATIVLPLICASLLDRMNKG
jgi:deoxyhypusine synthase (EC 2.5.1.46)